MNAPLAAAIPDDYAERWREWQARGLEGDRRRGVAMTWVMAAIAIALGVMFSGVL